MRLPSSLKREFLRKWVMGLQICRSWNKNKNMDVLARRNAIKLSADIAIAIASARNGAATTRWSRALISDASQTPSAGLLVQQITLGTTGSNKATATPWKAASNYRSVIRTRKMSRMIRRPLRRGRVRSGCARSIAKRLVRKRTEVLKQLVPGGRFMDEIGLIEETLDYIVALRAQVDVMQSLAGVYQQGINLHGN